MSDDHHAVVAGTEWLRLGGNDLLARAHPADLDVLARTARRERFARDTILVEALRIAERAFFIESGVASTVRPVDGQPTTEICLIGPEGFVGSAIAMTDGCSPYRTFVQADMLSAIVVDADELRTLFDRSATFRALLLRAIEAQTIQIAETLVIALWRPIRSQLARWLLLYRDRTRSDRLEVTHHFMALMVGAQRSKITATVHELEGMGAISASRGLVTIRDVELLEIAAQGRADTSEPLREPVS